MEIAIKIEVNGELVRPGDLVLIQSDRNPGAGEAETLGTVAEKVGCTFLFVDSNSIKVLTEADLAVAGYVKAGQAK